MVTIPEPSAVKSTVTKVLFFVYFTVNKLLAVKPLKVMLPVEVAHAVGLLPFVLPITGTGLITTETVASIDEQPFKVAFTLYTPAEVAEVVANVGFCVVVANPSGPVQE